MDKWEKNKKVLMETSKIRKNKIKNTFEKEKEEIIRENEKKLNHVKNSRKMLYEKEKTALITELLNEFSKKVFSSFLKWLLSNEGKDFIKNKIKQIKNENRRVKKIIIGKKISISGYSKGNFQYGFKIILDDFQELDFSEAYFNIFIQNRIYEVINEEIFGTNNI